MLLFFYLIFSAFNFQWPYANLQALSIGLTTSKIMLINGIVPFVTFGASPLLGFIGDKIGYKVTLVILLLVNAAVAVAFTLIPTVSTEVQHEVQIRSVDNITGQIFDNPFISFSKYSVECSDELNMTITKLVCNDKDYDIHYDFMTSYMNVTGYMCDDDKNVCIYNFDDNSTNQNSPSVFCDAYIEGETNEVSYGNTSLLFWLYVTCKIVLALSVGPAWNFVDALASKKCQQVNVDWAWVSVLGNIGAGVAPILTGQLINKVNLTDALPPNCLTGLIPDVPSYSFPFYCCAASLVFTAVVTCFLKIDIQPVRTDDSWRKELSWLLTWPAVGFYTLLVIHGIGQGVTGGFYAIFVVEELKVTEEWWGILFTIGLVSSIAFQGVGGLIHKHMGSMNIVVLCVALSTFQNIIVAYLEPYPEDTIPWALIFSGMLDLCNPLYVGVIGYVAMIAPDHLRAAALGFCASSIFVIGRGVGSLFGGMVNDQLVIGSNRFSSISKTLKIFGFAILGYSFVYFVIYHCFIKSKENPLDGIDGDSKTNKTDSNVNIAKKSDIDTIRSIVDKLDLAEKAPIQSENLAVTYF